MSDTGQNQGHAGSLADRVRSLKLNHAKTTSPKIAWLPWTLCLLLAGTSGYLAYQNFARPAREDGNMATPPAELRKPSAGLPATVASSGDLVYERKGHIIPTHKIQVSPKVAGMVTMLNFEEGKLVQKGDILAELEAIDYTSDRDRAAAAVGAARERYRELVTGSREEEKKQAVAALNEAIAMREQLQDEAQRLRAAGRATTPDDLVKVESRLLQAKFKVEQLTQENNLIQEGPRQEKIKAAEFDLRAAEAELAKAQWRLDNCVIRAPVSGTILSKKAEEGDIVNPVAFNVSASLCELADLSDLEVELNVEERDFAKIFIGQQCRIRPEAFPNRTYEGFVSKIIPKADRGQGAIPVRVKVVRLLSPKAESSQDLKQEQGQYLRPDMGANVSFLKKEEPTGSDKGASEKETAGAR